METTRTRKPTAERREEIVRAVLRIVGERGVTALSTATVAAEVGLTTGALFRHFPSFEAILDEVVRFAVRELDATFPDPAGPPLERLLALAERRVAALAGSPGLAWLLRSDQAALALPKEGAQALRALVARSRAFLRTALVEGAASGAVRRDLAPEALLVIVMGTIHALIGLTGAHRAAGGAASREAPPAVLDALARLLAPPAEAPAQAPARGAKAPAGRAPKPVTAPGSKKRPTSRRKP